MEKAADIQYKSPMYDVEQDDSGKKKKSLERFNFKSKATEARYSDASL